MMVMRPIKESDTEAFISLAFQQTTLGIRNLPKNKERLIKKIALSHQSFARKAEAPDHELYLFVMEDLSTNQLAGVSGIWIIDGKHKQEFFYRLDSIPSTCHWKEAPKDIKILTPVCPKESLTELGALFLHPSFHHQGLGPLLSLSRFLFAAAHPERFFQKIAADMRGAIHHFESAPFWDGLGRHFCDISYPELMTRLDLDPTVVPSLIPTHPIYVPLLPPDTQKSIGAIHESTAPAFKMLSREGFDLTNIIDLFDGGPRLVGKLDDLRTMAKSKTAPFGGIASAPISGETHLLSNERLDFRCCYGNIQLERNGSALLDKETADALKLHPGDTFRYLDISGHHHH